MIVFIEQFGHCFETKRQTQNDKKRTPTKGRFNVISSFPRKLRTRVLSFIQTPHHHQQLLVPLPRASSSFNFFAIFTLTCKPKMVHPFHNFNFNKMKHSYKWCRYCLLLFAFVSTSTRTHIFNDVSATEIITGSSITRFLLSLYIYIGKTFHFRHQH